MKNNLAIPFKKLTKEAITPSYSTANSVGLDLTATSKEVDKYGNLVFGTGLAFAIPEGYGGFLFSRSSISKYTLDLANAVGVIDPDYRGEVFFKFKPTISYSTDGINTEYSVGERIGQLIILEVPKIELKEEELDTTTRGEGGFGSTGL